MKIKIAGIQYDVQYCSNEEMNGLVGSADFNRQLIKINKDHTEQTQEIAAVHELLHIISDADGIGLTEEQIKILTHGIIAVHKDNDENLVLRSSKT